MEERVCIAMWWDGVEGACMIGCGGGSVGTMWRPGWWVATLYTFRMY